MGNYQKFVALATEYSMVNNVSFDDAIEILSELCGTLNC